MPNFKFFHRHIFHRRRTFSLRRAISSSPEFQAQTSPSHVSDLSERTCRNKDEEDTIGRSSQKASTYEPSPVCSGTTATDSFGVPSCASSEEGSLSSLEFNAALADALVQVISIGADDTATISTRTVDEDGPVWEHESALRKLKRMSLKRSKAAPPVLHAPPTMVESPDKPSPSATTDWNWGRLNFCRRVRTNHERKEARKGKAASVYSSSPEEPASTSSTAATFTSPFTHRRPQSSYHSAVSNISPRASISTCPQTPVTGHAFRTPPSKRASTQSRSDKNVPDHENRKDSHFLDAIQAKDKATAEMQAIIKLELEETPPIHPKRTSMIRRSVNRILHHTPYPNFTSAFSSTSGSSSGSDADEPLLSKRPGSKITRLPSSHNLPRYTLQTAEEAWEKQQLCDPPPPPPPPPSCDPPSPATCDAPLPPGFEVPEYGDAGPSDWMEKSWHQYENMEEKRRDRIAAFAMIARERSLECVGAAMKNVYGACGPPMETHAKPRKSDDSTASRGVVEGLWLGGKARFKGKASVDDAEATEQRESLETIEKKSMEARRSGEGKSSIGSVEVGSPRHTCVERMREDGVCVTTVTLGDCDFEGGQ